MTPRAASPTVRFNAPWNRDGSAHTVKGTYLLALVVIASTAIASHLLTARIVKQQASTARIINLAGRQRMLSQRIARVAEEVAAGTTDPAVGRQIVLEAAQGIQRTDNALAYGNPALGIPPPATSAIRAIYTQPPYQLKVRLQAFLLSARSVAAKPRLLRNDPDLRSMVVTLETSLLPGLEHAVWQYQRDAEASIASLQRFHSTLTWLMLAVLALEAVLIYRPLLNRLTQSLQQLLHASNTDMLTRVLNRSAFLQQAEAELTCALQAGRPTALVIANIDALKEVNARHGNAAGDLALRHFAAIAQSNLRCNDRVARLGGGEFALLLSGTALDGAIVAAERIRERLAGSTAALMPDNYRVFITGSFGVTVSAPGDDIAAMLYRADRLLRRAKAEGPNRVEGAAPTAVSTFVDHHVSVIHQTAA